MSVERWLGIHGAAAISFASFSASAGVIVKPAKNVSFYGSYTKSFLPQSGDQFSALDATQAWRHLRREPAQRTEGAIDVEPHLRPLGQRGRMPLAAGTDPAV